MDYLFQSALEPAENPLLPEEEAPGIVYQSVHNLNAEVPVYDDEVPVPPDTIPGTGTSEISVDLVNENTLRITCEQEEEKTGDDDGDCLREQHSFSLHQGTPLPCRVVPAGTRLSMRTSVLDNHLKKVCFQAAGNK